MTQMVDLFGTSVNLEKPEDNNGDKRLVLGVPADKELIVKFIADPRSPGSDRRAYVPLKYYNFKVGSSDKDFRSRPSLQSLGVVDKDPETEIKWELVKMMSALTKSGESKESQKYKNIAAKKKLFEPDELGWIYYIEPNSNVIKALKLKAALINQLFGKEANGDKYPAVPSLVKNMATKGMSPFDLSKEFGWVKIYKTGKEMATRYFAEALKEVTTVLVDGMPEEKTTYPRLPIHEDFKTGMVALDSFPDPIEFEKTQAFSVDETVEFINSDGVVFPERYAAKRKRNNDAETPVDLSSVANQYPQSSPSSLDDIPF